MGRELIEVHLLAVALWGWIGGASADDWNNVRFLIGLARLRCKPKPLISVGLTQIRGQIEIVNFPFVPKAHLLCDKR